MKLEQLGLVGNCQYSALVASSGDVVWCCMPRFDSEPIFGAPARPGRRDLLRRAAGRRARACSATSPTRTCSRPASTTSEGTFRVLDFAPRFELARAHLPAHAAASASSSRSPARRGSACAATRSSAGRRSGPPRCTARTTCATTASPRSSGSRPTCRSRTWTASPSRSRERQHFVLAWGAPVEEPLEPLCERFLRETTALLAALGEALRRSRRSTRRR